MHLYGENRWQAWGKTKYLNNYPTFLRGKMQLNSGVNVVPLQNIQILRFNENSCRDSV